MIKEKTAFRTNVVTGATKLKKQKTLILSQNNSMVEDNK